MNSCTKRLGELLHKTSYNDFSEQTIQNAKLAILDCIGTTIGGYCTSIGKSYTNSITADETGICTILGKGSKTALMEACLVNASLSQILDFDDTYEINSFAVSHPGPAIVPPSLALGEKLGVSGKQLIKAAILGYEVAIRVANAIEPRKAEYWGFANSQIMGSVTAAAILLGLSTSALINALGIAAACSPVPNTRMMWSLEERPMSWVKDGVGFSASTGVMSALLAKNGIIGPQNSLDKESGYYLVSGSETYEEEQILEDFGNNFQIDALSFKPYPTCRYIQSSLDCLESIVNNNTLSVDSIQSIDICLPPYFARIFADYEPSSMIDAQFSLPYAAAMILKKAPPSPRWYDNGFLDNKEIKQLGRKVKLIADSEVERRRVEENILSPRVRVVTEKGQEYVCQQDYAKGHPKRRFTREDFFQKFRRILLPVMEKDQTEKAIAAIDTLETCQNIAELFPLLSIKDVK